MNRVLLRFIPFNSPHKLRVTRIAIGEVDVSMPFIRKNKNHVGGMHACALATLSEYAFGLCLASYLDTDKYRLIIKNLSMEYHYQGKFDCYTKVKLDKEALDSQLKRMEGEDVKLDIAHKVDVYDSKENHISSCDLVFQVKDWAKVRAK